MLGAYDWWQIGRAMWNGLRMLLLNPVLYIGTGLMFLEIYRNSRQERKFFGFRMTRAWRSVVWRWLQALSAGLVASAVSLTVGLSVDVWGVGAVVVVSLLLASIRLRWLASIYGIAVVVAVAQILAALPVPHGPAWLVSLWQHLAAQDPADWLAIGALCCLLEAALLGLNRLRGSSPVLVHSKRGRTIGAWISQLGFVVPVLCIQPGNLPVPGLPWPWPLMGGLVGAAFAGGITLAGMPLVIGHSGVYAGLKPERGAGIVAVYSLAIGVLLAADAYVTAHFNSGLAWLGVVLALIGRELAVWHVHWRESLADPLYAPVAGGVKVLAVMSGSVADAMGLQPGEVITHVNQVPVHSTYDLHFAFDQNPAYAKLQVCDARGEIRIVGKPVFTGERAKLGLILAPDTPGLPSYRGRSMGLFQTLYLRVATSENPYEEVWVDTDPVPPHMP
jgi:hypothetical protein